VAERLLIESIPGELAAAMRARDQDTLSALRMLKTALTNKRVELARTLEPADELQVLTTLVKQRRDSIDQFTRAGRQELADQERRELAVLERYLPPAVDDATLQAVIAEVIAETGASSASDVGRVMKAVMGRLSGQLVDGKAVSAHVRAALA
jgi:uncharacterized protein